MRELRRPACGAWTPGTDLLSGASGLGAERKRSGLQAGRAFSQPTLSTNSGIVGTLAAWSIMVTLLTEGAASQGESLVAADLFFLDPALSSEDDDTDPLAPQAGDELALMLVE